MTQITQITAGRVPGKSERENTGNPERDPPRNHPPHLHILLVESDRDDAEKCREYLLSGLECTPEIIHTKRLSVAMSILPRQRIDVIILNLSLPDSTGMHTMLALRHVAMNIPIVVLAADHDVDLGIQVIREHAQDYCFKRSLTPDLLIQAIHNAIERHRLQSQYMRLLETSPDGMVVLDKSMRILFINQAAMRLLGINAPGILGKSLPDYMTNKEANEIQLPNERTAEVRAVDVDWNANPAVLMVYRDTTARTRAELQLKELIQFDQLTGLASRSYFLDYLCLLINQAARDETMFALLMIDLDRFKYINDTMGHEVGDQLLRVVADRLRQHTREGDFLARLGGDEFILVLPHIRKTIEAATVAQKLLDDFEAPFKVGDMNIGVGLSIGIAPFPQSGNDAQSLFRAADTAMYRAKDQGKHCYRYYTSSMQYQVEKRIRLEHSVRDAILKNDFWLAYQPQIRCRDGAPEAVEALMRWPCHNHLNLSPADFIPVIEDLGMITRVSRDVMKMSADAVHRISYAADYPVRVAINISMRHLFNNCLHDDIEKLIVSCNLTPWRMEIELTESTLMGDPVRAGRTLNAIRELGVTIAIDDFGTGYSSLSYLRRLPADVLKIDRSFILEIGQKAEAEAILLSLIDLAHALGMRVVAEGVENAEQQAFLEDANCDLLQGFHICRPCTEPDLIEWLRGRLPM